MGVGRALGRGVPREKDVRRWWQVGRSTQHAESADGSVAAKVPMDVWHFIMCSLWEAHPEAIPAARLVCKPWAAAGAAAIKEIVPESVSWPSGWPSTWANVTSIDCSRVVNYLTDFDLEVLVSLPALRSLQIDQPLKLTHGAIGGLSSVQTLRSLTLTCPVYPLWCETSISMAESLVRLTGLTSLTLRNGPGLPVKLFASLTRLTSLDLSRCHDEVEDCELSVLLPLTRLSTLKLSRRRLLDAEVLKELPSLTSLEMFSCLLPDYNSITALTNLRGLGLEGCLSQSMGTICESQLRQLFNLSGQIERLNLRDLYFKNYSTLSAYTSVRTLNLSYNRRLEDDGLALIASRLTALEHLNLTDCIHVSDRAFRSFSHLSKLLSLTLAVNHQLTDNCIPHIARLTSLTYLSLKATNVCTLGHPPQDGKSWQAPRNSLRRLQRHSSSQAVPCSNGSIGQLTNLTELDLQACNQLTDLGLFAITPLRKLRKLYLWGSSEVTSTGTDALQELPSLMLLCIRSTYRMQKSLEHLQRQQPNLCLRDNVGPFGCPYF